MARKYKELRDKMNEECRNITKKLLEQAAKEAREGKVVDLDAYLQKHKPKP